MFWKVLVLCSEGSAFQWWRWKNQDEQSQLFFSCKSAVIQIGIINKMSLKAMTKPKCAPVSFCHFLYKSTRKNDSEFSFYIWHNYDYATGYDCKAAFNAIEYRQDETNIMQMIVTNLLSFWCLSSSNFSIPFQSWYSFKWRQKLC